MTKLIRNSKEKQFAYFWRFRWLHHDW